MRLEDSENSLAECFFFFELWHRYTYFSMPSCSRSRRRAVADTALLPVRTASMVSQHIYQKNQLAGYVYSKENGPDLTSRLSAMK